MKKAALLDMLSLALGLTVAHAEPEFARSATPWMADLQVSNVSFGIENITAVPSDNAAFPNSLRVAYPLGSWSPRASRSAGLPVGGAGFSASLGLLPCDHAFLRYYVRFSPGFKFGKGGKLPGLYGGTANTGGRIPTGEDGFTVRLMWREDGAGEVYAYLPGCAPHGAQIGRGAWHFVPGHWYLIQEEVVLNTPGKLDGLIRLLVNGTQVILRDGLRFRDTPALKIDGLLFSTFFGGGDRSWAAPADEFAEFGGFAASTALIQP